MSCNTTILITAVCRSLGRGNVTWCGMCVWARGGLTWIQRWNKSLSQRRARFKPLSCFQNTLTHKSNCFYFYYYYVVAVFRKFQYHVSFFNPSQSLFLSLDTVWNNLFCMIYPERWTDIVEAFTVSSLTHASSFNHHSVWDSAYMERYRKKKKKKQFSPLTRNLLSAQWSEFSPFCRALERYYSNQCFQRPPRQHELIWI